MRRYQKWLSVGLFALTPGIAMAGALNSPQLKLGQGPATATTRPARRSKAAANQELAEKIAKALRNAKLDGYDIDIDVRDGVVVLDGFVTRNEQRNIAARVARNIPGVTAVKNRLRIEEPSSTPLDDQSAVEPQRHLATPGFVRLVSHQAGDDRSSPVQHAAGYEGGPVETLGPMLSTPAGSPVYGPPAAEAGHAMPNQPYLPSDAAPAYVQYPGYATATYPPPYPAGAWPYMGPFHPYPQCPLGWRKVTMQWDEGLWTLDFGSRKRHWWQ
jgi:hypothetical protein